MKLGAGAGKDLVRSFAYSLLWCVLLGGLELLNFLGTIHLPDSTEEAILMFLTPGILLMRFAPVADIRTFVISMLMINFLFYMVVAFLLVGVVRGAIYLRLFEAKPRPNSNS